MMWQNHCMISRPFGALALLRQRMRQLVLELLPRYHHALMLCASPLLVLLLLPCCLYIYHLTLALGRASGLMDARLLAVKPVPLSTSCCSRLSTPQRPPLLRPAHLHSC